MKAKLAFVLVAALAPSAASQCLVPDGLNGPCCAASFANLPVFPAYQMQGLAICWQQCVPTATPCIKWDIAAPSFVACDKFNANVDVYDCTTGAIQLTGSLVLDYTRTWEEVTPTGQLQVWRFAAKVDLATSAAAPFNPCIVPPSLAAFPTVFYYGYVDYARDCTTGVWEMATVLMHQCDWFIHGSPIFSSTPGLHHPGRNFALVGPDSPANPFTPAIMPAPFGGLVGEGTRTTAVPGALCSVEEPLQGAISPLLQACVCAPAGQPPQLTARRLNTGGACGTAVASLDLLSSGLPWFHLMTTSVGTWTTTTGYPGPEAVWVDEGPVAYFDGCPDPTGVQSVFADVLYGATTAKGFQVLPTGTPPPSAMTDLASNFSWKLGNPLPLPMYGNVLPTRHVVYVSLP